MTIPTPRPEVVDLLAELFEARVMTGAKDERLESRFAWSTGAERAAALARLTAAVRPELARYRHAADQQDAERRGAVPEDGEWLRGIGVAP